MTVYICWYIQEFSYLCFLGIYFLLLFSTKLLSLYYQYIFHNIPVGSVYVLPIQLRLPKQIFHWFRLPLEKRHQFFLLLLIVLCKRHLKLLLPWFLPSLIFHCVHIFQISHVQTILRFPLLLQKNTDNFIFLHFWVREWGKHFISIPVRLFSPTLC